MVIDYMELLSKMKKKKYNIKLEEWLQKEIDNNSREVFKI